jgi:hypothetical protein
MKWLVLAFFAAAFLCSLHWLDSGERNYSSSTQIALAASALAGWAVVCVLGIAML